MYDCSKQGPNYSCKGRYNHSMPITPATPAEVEQILAILAETPRRIAAVTAAREEKDLSHSLDLESWSAVENLAHLRGCAEVWGKTIRAMLAQERPRLPLIRPREWVRRQGYTRRSFAETFQAFELERIGMLDILRPLPLSDWDRSAEIDGRSPTVFSQAQRMALHEAHHCEQIEALFLSPR